MTPTGHSDRIQPSFEPRVVGSRAVDFALPLIPVLVVLALWQPLFTLGVVVGASSTRLVLGQCLRYMSDERIHTQPSSPPDIVNR